MYRKVNYIADSNGFKVKIHSNENPPAPGVKEGTIDPRINPVIHPSVSSSSIQYVPPYEPVQSESNEDNIHIYESRRGQIKPLDERDEQPVTSHYSTPHTNYANYQSSRYPTTKKPSSYGNALFGSYYKSLRDKSHDNDEKVENLNGGSEGNFESDFNQKFKRVPKYQMPNDGSNNQHVNTIMIASNSPYITEGLRKSNNYVEDPSVKPYLPRAIKVVKLKSYKKVDTRDLDNNSILKSYQNSGKPEVSTPVPSSRYFQSQYHQQQLRAQQLPNSHPPNYGITIDHGHQQFDRQVVKTYPKPGTSRYFDNADWLRSVTTPIPKVESHFTWYKPQAPATNHPPATGPAYDQNPTIVRRPSAPPPIFAPTTINPSSGDEHRFLSDHTLFEKRSKVIPTEKKENLNTIESSNEIIQNEIEGKYYGHVPFGARLSGMGKNNSSNDQSNNKSDDLKRFYLHYESTRNAPIERIPNLDLNRTRSEDDEIIHLTYNKMTPKVHYDLEREALFSDNPSSDNNHKFENDKFDDNSVIDEGIDKKTISKRIDEGSEEETSTTKSPLTTRKKYSYESYEPPITSKDTILDKWSARIWPPPSKKT